MLPSRTMLRHLLAVLFVLLLFVTLVPAVAQPAAPDRPLHQAVQAQAPGDGDETAVGQDGELDDEGQEQPAEGDGRQEVPADGDGQDATPDDEGQEQPAEGDGEDGPLDTAASEAGQEDGDAAPPGDGGDSSQAEGDETGEEAGEPGETGETSGQIGEDGGAIPEVALDGEDVVATDEGGTVWRFGFPEASGGTGALLALDGTVWVGHGNSVIVLDRQSGVAQERYAMPGRVIRLEDAEGGISAVSELEGTLRQRIEIGPRGPVSTVRFADDPQLYDWLRNEARVEAPASRLEQDPTNAWLWLRAGLASSDEDERNELLTGAVDLADTFYDAAGIAQELAEAGEYDLAGQAMDVAASDFEARDYDPRLLDDPATHITYHFPLEPMREALAAGDLRAADFWAPWLYLLGSAEAPQTRESLVEYSRQLADAGRGDASALWRERSREGGSSSPTASLDNFFLRLASAGWYPVAALLMAIVALHLTLVAKYWAPQTLAARRRIETGGSRRPWLRALAIRYYSFTEKLVLVLLFASLLVLLGLTHWHQAAGERPGVLTHGSLATPTAQDMIAGEALEGARGAFVRGFAAHQAGELQQARAHYQAAGDYPPALNNLAAIEGDEALWQRALDLAPAMPEAAYNLGRRSNPSPFHATYREDEPLLAVPDEGDFRTAAGGTWQEAVGSSFRNPWQSLRDMEFFGVHPVVWQVLLALLLLWMIVSVLWLLVPRPAFARNAPRTNVYHLLALLIPGAGLADEAWGILLMVPWALLGVDALAQWAGWERPLGLPIDTVLWALAAIYVVNLIAFVVEFVSYRRRMRELERRQPELHEAYRLRRA